MCWNPKYIVLILFSTMITYLSGLFIDVIKKKVSRDYTQKCYIKVGVAVSFLLNLLILFYFKYFEFTITAISRIIGIIGVRISVPAYDVILPVGISFYIFQALGYTMDVYRGVIQAEKNYFRYAHFVAFFHNWWQGLLSIRKFF